MASTRREFLKTFIAGGGALLTGGPLAWAFDPVRVENPLGSYPDRGWERLYLDQYGYDSTFTWVCAPNDTHMCRMRAFVRNGVMIRSEQNYDHDRCGDLYGNRATAAWNPRGCPKGFTMQRRIYGPYRLKGPVLRTGWKEWADAGFPSLSDSPEPARSTGSTIVGTTGTYGSPGTKRSATSLGVSKPLPANTAGTRVPVGSRRTATNVRWSRPSKVPARAP